MEYDWCMKINEKMREKKEEKEEKTTDFLINQNKWKVNILSLRKGNRQKNENKNVRKMNG